MSKQYKYDYKNEPPILYTNSKEEQEAYVMGIKNCYKDFTTNSIGQRKGVTVPLNDSRYKELLSKAIPWPKVKAKLLDETAKPVYQYGDINDAKAGDIVQLWHEGYQGSYTHKNLYVVKGTSNHGIETALDDKGSTGNGFARSNFKLVKTLPGLKAKVGDTVISLNDPGSCGSRTAGSIHTVIKYGTGKVFYYKKEHSSEASNFRVLCKAEEAVAQEPIPQAPPASLQTSAPKSYTYDYKYPIYYISEAEEAEAVQMGVKGCINTCINSGYPRASPTYTNTTNKSTFSYKRNLINAIPWPVVKQHIQTGKSFGLELGDIFPFRAGLKDSASYGKGRFILELFDNAIITSVPSSTRLHGIGTWRASLEMAIDAFQDTIIETSPSTHDDQIDALVPEDWTKAFAGRGPGITTTKPNPWDTTVPISAHSAEIAMNFGTTATAMFIGDKKIEVCPDGIVRAVKEKSNSVEETQMSDKTTVEVKVNGVDVLKSTKATKAKTALQLSKKYQGTLFSANGYTYANANFDTKKQARKFMQQPGQLGLTLKLWKADSIITTNIPIVTKKA